MDENCLSKFTRTVGKNRVMPSPAQNLCYSKNIASNPFTKESEKNPSNINGGVIRIKGNCKKNNTCASNH